uniref:Putative secreted protein n=1 Tax=Anopheles marajoara TaxID=58244 RepID=A0A2M4C9M2_9DIPT
MLIVVVLLMLMVMILVRSPAHRCRDLKRRLVCGGGHGQEWSFNNGSRRTRQLFGRYRDRRRIVEELHRVRDDQEADGIHGEGTQQGGSEAAR